MSKANPRKAVTAIMPLPLQVGTENGEPLVVRPMTLAMYAALERIGSPLLTGQEPENALDWLPTLYLVTHDPSEIFSGNLSDKAFAWADAQPVSIVRRIRDAAMRQIDALVDVIPEADPDEKKKRRGSDGWIAAYAAYAAEHYGWSYREIMYEVPASAIALLRRTAGLRENKIFPLSSVEEIDNGNEKADRRGRRGRKQGQAQD